MTMTSANSHDMAYLAGYEAGASSEQETVAYLYRQVMLMRAMMLATLTAAAIIAYLYLRSEVPWRITLSPSSPR